MKESQLNDVLSKAKNLTMEIVKVNENEVQIRFKTLRKINLSKIQNFTKTVNINSIQFHENYVKLIVDGVECTVKVINDTLHIACSGSDVMNDIIKVIVRAILCVNCRMCVAWCPRSALIVNGDVKVIPEKCNSCRVCYTACPIVQYFAKVS